MWSLMLTPCELQAVCVYVRECVCVRRVWRTETWRCNWLRSMVNSGRWSIPDNAANVFSGRWALHYGLGWLELQLITVIYAMSGS